MPTMYRETFLEHTAYETEWNGTRIRVTVTPPVGQSSTSQMVLDHRQFDECQYLKPFPFGVDHNSPAWHEWNLKRDLAKRTVDIIAQKIAYDVCKFIGEQK